MPEAGNVVRLPREWLGPPEELVPFGPSARARASDRPEPDAQEPAASSPDFWSEESAVLQDVIEAPADPDVVQTTEAVEEPSATHARHHAEARPRRLPRPLSRHRRVRELAGVVLALCAIAGAVVIASQGAGPAARISRFSSGADSVGGSLPRVVALAQASLAGAETNLTRATRHPTAPRRHPGHQEKSAVSGPSTTEASAPAAAENGTSQAVGSGSSPQATQSATPSQSQNSPPAGPAQPAASTSQPPHPSPLGGLACGC